MPLTSSCLRRRASVSFRPRLEILEGRDLPSFLAPTSASGGAPAQAVVTADLNGDGRCDLVTANTNNNCITVLLGKASGFNSKTYAVGTQPTAVAVGDVNGDGKLDVITANWGAGNISVLLGDGRGGFGTAHNYAGGTHSFSVAVGDFNGDGKLDVVTGNNNGTLSVLLNTGTGAFGTPQNYPVTGTQYALAVGDFTGDSKADVLALNGGSVSLLPGNGDGTLGAAQTVWAGTGDNLTALAAGDFNHDGKLDFAVTDSPSTVLWNTPTDWIDVWLNNGTGTFAGGGGIAAQAWQTASLVVADVNGDGNLDLVTAGQGSTGYGVGVLPGNGNGTFGTAQYTFVSQTLGYPAFVAAGDFTGDGYVDVAVIYGNSGAIEELINAGSGKKA